LSVDSPEFTQATYDKVADAYDGMVSAPAYHDPKSHDEASMELVRGSGSQFDPDVIRVWMRETETARCS